MKKLLIGIFCLAITGQAAFAGGQVQQQQQQQQRQAPVAQEVPAAQQQQAPVAQQQAPVAQQQAPEAQQAQQQQQRPAPVAQEVPVAQQQQAQQQQQQQQAPIAQLVEPVVCPGPTYYLELKLVSDQYVISACDASQGAPNCRSHGPFTFQQMERIHRELGRPAPEARQGNGLNRRLISCLALVPLVGGLVFDKPMRRPLVFAGTLGVALSCALPEGSNRNPELEAYIARTRAVYARLMADLERELSPEALAQLVSSSQAAQQAQQAQSAQVSSDSASKVTEWGALEHQLFLDQFDGIVERAL